jgi:hypothetical protein
MLISCATVYLGVGLVDRTAEINTVIDGGLSVGDTGKVLALIDIRTTLAPIGFATFNPVEITIPGGATRTVSPLEGYFWVEEYLAWSQSGSEDWNVVDLGLDLSLDVAYLTYMNEAVAAHKNLRKTRQVALRLAEAAYGGVVPTILEVASVTWNLPEETFYESTLAAYPNRPMWPSDSGADLDELPEYQLALARSLMTDDVFFDVKNDIEEYVASFISSVNARALLDSRSAADSALLYGYVAAGVSVALLVGAVAFRWASAASRRFGNREGQGKTSYVNCLVLTFSLLALVGTAYSVYVCVSVNTLYPSEEVQAIPDIRFDAAVFLRNQRLNLDRLQVAAMRFVSSGDVSHLADAKAYYDTMVSYIDATRTKYGVELVAANNRDEILTTFPAALDAFTATGSDAAELVRFLFAAMRLGTLGHAVPESSVLSVFPELLDAEWLLTDDEILEYELVYDALPFLYDLETQAALTPTELGHVARMAMASKYLQDLTSSHVDDLITLSTEIRAFQSDIAEGVITDLTHYSYGLIAAAVIAGSLMVVFAVLVINTLLPSHQRTAVPIVQKISSAVLHRASLAAYASLVGYFLLVAAVAVVTLQMLLVELVARSTVVDYGHKRAEAAVNIAFAATSLVSDASSPTLHRSLLRTGANTLSTLQEVLMYGSTGSADTSTDSVTGLVTTHAFDMTVDIAGSFGDAGDATNNSLLVSDGPICTALENAGFESNSAACVAAVPEDAGMREAVAGPLWPLVLGFVTAAETLVDVPSEDLSDTNASFRFIVTLLPSLLSGLEISNAAYSEAIASDLAHVTITQQVGWGVAVVALASIFFFVLRKGILSLAAEDEVIFSMLARLPAEVLTDHPELKAALMSIVLNDGASQEFPLDA